MKKVVIIGAGPAGLTAGYELLKNNKREYEVVILEAEKQVGGISKTINYKGNRMDLGGHRFFSKDEKIKEIWKDLMPLQGVPSIDDEKLGRKSTIVAKGPNPNTENKVMLIRNRISRIYYLKKFFDYPVSFKLETIKKLGLLRTTKAVISYLKSIIVKKNRKFSRKFLYKPIW